MTRSAARKSTTPADGALAKYYAKRDPSKTPEPMASTRSTRSRKSAPIFVVQEHHASSLHWDFRLEHEGVLVSWALPKGVPVDPRTNHLAVPTEDHPLDYGAFEGDIPEGEYGAGHVAIWDRGTYTPEVWRDDEVKFLLNGSRVSGRFALFRVADKRWMIHRMDAPATELDDFPALVKPMLASPGQLSTRQGGWAYEFKWDGVRAMLYVEGGRVRALTRNDRNIVANFPELSAVGESLGSRRAVLDGEIVAVDEQGHTSFAALSHRLHLTSSTEIKQRALATPANFFAFDVVYLEGRSLLKETYDHRRRVLESLDLNGESFTTPPSLTGVSGERALAISRERQLEGIVAKRRDSPYSPGRRGDAWIKIKNFRTQEVVIGGWTEGAGERAGSLGALLLGVPSGKGLDYVGKVGTGFSVANREDLMRRLVQRRRKNSPFSDPLPRRETSECHFVRPDLVGEVTFVEWTEASRLRSPSWRGLRADKTADEVQREF